MDFVPRNSVARPRPVTSQPKPQPQPESKPQAIQPVSKKAEEITQVEEIDFGIVEDYQPAKPAQDAPDANKYSLGGKSPFLESVTVEKRPLSNNIPAHAEYHLHKNIYTKKQALEKPNPTPTAIIKPESKKSKAPLILLIFATVIVGAAVGAGVYFFFFQGQ